MCVKALGAYHIDHLPITRYKRRRICSPIPEYLLGDLERGSLGFRIDEAFALLTALLNIDEPKEYSADGAPKIYTWIKQSGP